jgi:hypothetical protein
MASIFDGAADALALFLNQRYPNSEPPEAIINMFSDVATALGAVAELVYVAELHGAASPVLLASAANTANIFAGLGLGLSVISDLNQIIDALVDGDQALADEHSFNLLSGLLGGSAVLVLTAILIPTAPLLPAFAFGYLIGQILYDDLKEFSIPDFIDNIYDVFEPIFDMIDVPVSFAGMFDFPLLNILRDPLVLDLDGDGIELSPIAGSTVHFDYDQDGFAEKTGWVSADDGILVVDSNVNGLVDGAAELFGSPTQDGFAVLETYDTNGDGKIDAADDAFGSLRVWRDLDQDGASDAGEMMTLVEAGITSLSLSRGDIAGTNNGHGIGFEGQYTRTDGTTGNAQTIYFQTDRRDTRADNTPNFTPAVGVEKLPQLAGSGLINSTTWKATQDTTFRDAWTALTDEAANLTRDELRARFEDLMLRWASVDGVFEGSRGQYVDAQHLAFVEKFFGTTYQEIGAATSTSPTTMGFGARIEASFDQVVDVMLMAFLAQNVASVAARGGSLAALIENPYFPYALLDFRSEWPTGTQPPATPGNVGAVLELIKGFVPEQAGAAARFLEKALAGMDGVSSAIFGGDRAAYLAVAQPVLAVHRPGSSALTLSVNEENSNALRLYRRCGFVSSGTSFMGRLGTEIVLSCDVSELLKKYVADRQREI